MPSLYAGWTKELGIEMPLEELATCGSCPMCASNGEETANTFNPDLKCCSFVPTLPNFLVGMILSETDPALAGGKATLRHRMRDISAMTPLGLAVRSDLRLIYESANAFGRGEMFRCPHYVDGGLCGIWSYRNAVCSTWFCKHVRGATGQRVWSKIRDLLGAVESELALVCALEIDRSETIGTDLVDLSAKASREAMTQAVVPAEAERQFQSLWRGWAERTEEFYVKCAAIVREMKWVEVEMRCGVNVSMKVRAVRAAYEDLVRADLPPRLVPGRFTVSAADSQELKLVTYSPYDPLNVGKELLGLLPYFTGDLETHAVLERIASQENVAIDEASLRQLVDHGVLRAAS